MVDINIKVIHKEAVRRFTLSSNATWIELEAKLRTLFSIPALSPFTLSYTDEDNDVITLSTDAELREILSSAPTIKFNLKFSTSDDSSDSEDSGNEVWVLEGGNLSRKGASITKIETDTSGLQDNVSQKNIVSTTNQELKEPQFIEIDPRDINETSDKKVDDDREEVNEKTHQVNPLDDEFFESFNKLKKPIHKTQLEEVNEKTHQVNLLDDEFFESVNKSKKLVHETQFEEEEDEDEEEEEEEEDEEEEEEEKEEEEEEEEEDEQKPKETIEASSSDNTFTHSSLEQDQSQQQRQDPEVDLQLFQMMIGQNRDAIKENPQLVASINDIMDQIQRLDSFRPIAKLCRNNNFFNRSTSPPPECTRRHTLPASEFNRSLTPPPIPGSFPTRAIPVPWATQPRDELGRSHGTHFYERHDHDSHKHECHRGRRGHRHRNRRHHDNHYHEQGEKTLDEGATLETEEASETTDLQIYRGMYEEQVEQLYNMGFKNETIVVNLLISHEGNIEQVIDELLNNSQM